MMTMKALLLRRNIVTERPFLFQWRYAKKKRALSCASADFKWKTKHSSTPSASTPDEAAASKLVEDKKVWEQQPKRTLFPWRHEPEPLERLVNHNVRGGLDGPAARPFPWYFRLILTQLSGVLLGIPWYKVLTTSGWKQEIADASGYAFSQAVAGVLSNTYKVPFKEIVSEDGVVDFSIVTEEESKEVGDEPPSDPVEDSAKEAQETEDDPEIVAPEIEYMMEKKLRKLYEACHEFGKDQIQIKLQTVPVHCELVSLLFIPYLTRQAVYDSPSLRHTFRNMYRAVQEQSIDEHGNKRSLVSMIQALMDQGYEHINSRAQINSEERTATLESTVIAQVWIECEEAFSVTDASTGMLLQGHGEKQRVSHLVRLEIVVKEIQSLDTIETTRQVQSWQIVDWDDLEDGNIWYV